MAGLSDGLQKRLKAAGIGTSGPSGQALDPWEVWLRLRAHSGRRATLVDLYELEAARQGIRPEELSAADRQRLKAASLHARRDQAEVVLGSARGVGPHEVISYDPNWPAQFRAWRDRLADVLGRAAVRIDHVGSTSVPGLAAKPIIDVQVSVPEVDDERLYLCRAEKYAALKKELIVRWCHDRKAYGDSKTDFVLDTLADAAEWAIATGWRT